MVCFDGLKASDTKKIVKIVNKYVKMLHKLGQGFDSEKINVIMDISAAHLSCPMDLDKMIKDEVMLGHDVTGIRHHLNRDTGLLEHCFLPRSAR